MDKLFFFKCQETIEIYLVLFIFTASADNWKARYKASSHIYEIISYLVFKDANDPSEKISDSCPSTALFLWYQRKVKSAEKKSKSKSIQESTECLEVEKNVIFMFLKRSKRENEVNTQVLFAVSNICIYYLVKNLNADHIKSTTSKTLSTIQRISPFKLMKFEQFCKKEWTKGSRNIPKKDLINLASRNTGAHIKYH